MEFTEKKVLVFGTGISGVAAANLLENAGAEVVLFDGNEKLDKAHVLENFTESKTPELYVGVLPEEVEKELDLVVLSPGVPVDLPLVLRLKVRLLKNTTCADSSFARSRSTSSS